MFIIESICSRGNIKKLILSFVKVTCFEADKACNLNKRNDEQKSYKSHSYIKHTNITIDNIKNTLRATT